MAGIANTWLRINQRLAAFLMRKGGIPFARAAQDQLGRLGARAVGARVEFVPHAFAQFQACWILPQGYSMPWGLAACSRQQQAAACSPQVTALRRNTRFQRRLRMRLQPTAT